MQSSGGAKNPPWARSNVSTNMSGMNPQIMDPSAMMSQQGMMSFQQGQVFNPNMMQGQGGMAMPMAGQMPMNQMAQGQMYPGNVVAYPTPRALNPGMYQNANSNQSPSNAEQRVFTGTVTKTHNDFGFVDHDVFYQTSVCAKGVIPKVNDRVLVEASYNPNMPFKWNATRVQVLPKGQGGPIQNKNNPKSNNYNAVPPPNRDKMPMRDRNDRMNNRRGGPGGGGRNNDRSEDRLPHKRSRSRSRSRSRERRDRENSRARRDSPPRKRPTVHQPSPVKYMVRVPRMPLDIKEMDVPTISQRYNNLYIPSDFFNAEVKWGETFPPQAPFSLNNPCRYHIMAKEIENPVPNDAVLEPSDADYKFSAKVMLLSLPSLEYLYQKCGLTKSDDKEKRNSKSPLHPTRLIKFLVGQKGKNGENFAIGGPWSPSLDGENPDTDPKVLVKTAIRTCKALTGIDLSSCAQWYRMVEFYYWREGSGGKSRLETVVLFLPDVWSAQTSRVDWTHVKDLYKAAHEAALRRLDAPPPPAEPAAPPVDQPAPAPKDKDLIEPDANNSTITIDENDDDDEEKPEPTHYSNIDLRTIKVDPLRKELRARNTSCKGLRPALLSRLSKLLKEEEANDTKSEDVMEVADENEAEAKPEGDDKEDVKEEADAADDKEGDKEAKEKESENKDKPETEEPPKKSEKEIEEEKRKLEREKQQLKARYEIPTQPHLIVHPCGAAKGGRFNASVASLSLLLDYRVTDNKEHSFELFVFAELFNEMLMRDFGFYIYKTLYTLPEKTEEVKEKAEDKAEKKDENKDKDNKDKDNKDKDGKDKDKKEESKERDSKDAKRDEKRESRDSRRPGRDRRESHSDEERGASPRRRGRGVELPPDPYLLLSLVYFDTARGGLVSKKDLQNLFMSLGLQLSRSQIRTVMDKVCIKETFNYKTLIQTIKDLTSGIPEAMQDMPLDATVLSAEVPDHIAELESTIASGNRDLLPVFNRGSGGAKGTVVGDTVDVSDSGCVVYKSCVVEVGALVAGAARAAALNARLECAMEAARGALRTARHAANVAHTKERAAAAQLADLTAALQCARARIASLTASSKIFHSALKSIQTKVEAVVNIKYEDDDVVEIVNGPNTPTTIKKETKEEVKPESKDDAIDEITTDKSELDAKDEKLEDNSDNIATESMDLDDKE